MEFEKLKQIVAEILSVDPRELTEETNFIDDLCADSRIFTRSFRKLKRRLKLQYQKKRQKKIKTVGEAVELIRKTRNE